MGDNPETGRKINLSPGMAKWMGALSGAGKLDDDQARKFLDLVTGGGGIEAAKITGLPVSGKSLPMYAVRVALPEKEEEGEEIFEVEYQVGDKPSVKISGTLEEIRAQLTKTD